MESKGEVLYKLYKKILFYYRIMSLLKNLQNTLTELICTTALKMR